MFVHVCPWLGVFARGKAETRWDFFRPTLCSVSALVRGCGRSLLVSTATETKARWLWKSPRWDCKIHTVSLARWKPFQNLCKWMQKTAEITEDCMLWLFFFFVFFCLSPETHIYLFIFISLALPPAPLSSLLAFPHRLTLPLQICIGKNEEIDGFLRLSSGKKRGLVPVKCLLEIWRCCFRLDPHFVTVMEEYSGVFSQHLTDHQPPASISKMWQWKQCEWKITHNFAFYRSLRPKGCRGFLAII